ncbi:hypothetical protein ZWY2020_040513 [Hordeum vulgare]|nr:hypothetical protein ZWY2020_040513 [Hordeum vulgare]
MFAPRKVEDEMALGRQRTVRISWKRRSWRCSSRKLIILCTPTRTVLVTGGAGYIGSHAVLQLLAAGFRAVVVDSLENSSELAARRGTRAEPLLPQDAGLHSSKFGCTEALGRRIPKKTHSHQSVLAHRS